MMNRLILGSILISFPEAWHEFPGLSAMKKDFYRSKYGVGIPMDEYQSWKRMEKSWFLCQKKMNTLNVVFWWTLPKLDTNFPGWGGFYLVKV